MKIPENFYEKANELRTMLNSEYIYADALLVGMVEDYKKLSERCNELSDRLGYARRLVDVES